MPSNGFYGQSKSSQGVNIHPPSPVSDCEATGRGGGGEATRCFFRQRRGGLVENDQYRKKSTIYPTQQIYGIAVVMKDPTPPQKQGGLGPQGRCNPRMYVRVVVDTVQGTVHLLPLYGDIRSVRTKCGVIWSHLDHFPNVFFPRFRRTGAKLTETASFF